MKDLTLSQWLLLAAAFLAPIMGGHVSTDQVALAPGIASLLGSLVGGAEAPILSHSVIAGLTALALAIALARRQVIQVPKLQITAAAFAFFGLLVASLLLSRFKTISVAALMQWLSYGLALFATVALLGRRRGPVLFAMASFAGCLAVACYGLYEYSIYRTIDPNWRIFAGWNNPNALAGMLTVGLLLGLGLVVVVERLAVVAIGFGAIVIGLALVLTQSRGGYLAALVGGVALVVLVAFWSGGLKRAIPNLLKLGVCVAALAIGVFLLMSQRASPPVTSPQAHRSAVAFTLAQDQSAPIGRVGRTAEFEQSAGFRRNLWKGAIELLKLNPLGYGIGTYRFESARPGLTTYTHFTHNSFLQIAVEAGIVGILALLVFAVLWLAHVMRSKSLPAEQNLLRATLVAAIVASGAHSMLDSDLYMFGIGWSFFALVGVSLLLSADAVVPEYTPKGARWSGIVVAAVTSLAMLHAGTVEALRARARSELAARDFEGAADLVSRALALSPSDGETYRLAANVAAYDYEQVGALRRAGELHPSARNLRAYGRRLWAGGDSMSAIDALKAALESDPNNLLVLVQLMEAQITYGDEAAAANTATRLVAVEQKPYFQVRSIPEVVPVETAMARTYLARISQDPSEQKEMLRGAVDIYERYLRTTLPLLWRMSVGSDGKPDPNLAYAGDTLANGWAKMRHAAEAARALGAIYRAEGDAEAVAWADSLAAEFEAAGTPDLPMPK